MKTESANSRRTADISLTWNDKVIEKETSSTQRENIVDTPLPQSEPVLKPEPAPAPEEKPTQEEKPAKGSKASSCAGILLDTLLVLVLLGGLGAGAWYVMQELEKYRVPSPLEMAQAEHLELCKQHEALQDASYQADEQIHLRERLSALETQIADVKRQITEHKRAIQEEEARELSLQREIRKEDKTSRAVARSLMIGLPIGNAATTRGKVYQNAVIHRLQAGNITLRFTNGQATFPLSILIKDNLPDIVRYALGVDDLVDMSDFNNSRKQRKGKLITPRKAPTKVSTKPVSYEPAAAVPVVNTQSPAVITVTPGLTPDDDGSWDAPTAPLPL